MERGAIALANSRREKSGEYFAYPSGSDWTIAISRAAITSGEKLMSALLAVLAIGFPLVMVVRRQLRPNRDSQWSATVSRTRYR